jgi:hypothetical protein
MTWAVDASGNQTATIGTDHTLRTTAATPNATFILAVDTTNLANGDLLELRVYDRIDGTNLRQCWKGTYQHAQINNGKESPPVAITSQAEFHLKQVAGTGRTYQWVVRSQ